MDMKATAPAPEHPTVLTWRLAVLGGLECLPRSSYVLE